MHNIGHGDIYLIEFDPSTGHEYQKTRPAVILSSNEVMLRSSFITCIPLTSNTARSLHDDIFVVKNSENNLYSDSLLKSQHISTFDRSRVVKYIGQLGVSDMKKLKVIVRSNLDL